MRFVKEEHHFWLIGITDLGQFFEKFREEPEQECRIEHGGVDKFIRGQNRDASFTLVSDAHHIFELKRGFTEKLLRAGAFKL